MRISSFINYLTYEKRYSAHTVEAYARDIGFFESFLKEYNIDDPVLITSMHIRSYLVGLIDNKNSPATSNRKLSVLRTYFKFLMKSHVLDSDPSAGVASMKKGRRLPVFLSEGEMDCVLEPSLYIDNEAGERDYTMMMLLYGTGIRREELINLKVSDINFSQRTIKVFGKGGKDRIVPVSTQLSEQLKRYINRERQKRENIISDYLFLTNKGTKLYPKLVYNVVNKYLSMVTTISKRSPHVLRHSYATHLSDNGAELNAVKELLGHAGLAATQIYTHNSIKRLQEIYNTAHPKSRKD